MATYTGNLNLKKPALDDDALITDINNNMDILDAAANGIEDALAIVANGNTHVAISAGQFVYVRNHSTLTEGLYVASSNIAANATLSTSNLTADSAGGLNALNSKITWSDITSSCTWNDSITTTNRKAIYKKGLVAIQCTIYPDNLTNGATIVTIPYDAKMNTASSFTVDDGMGTPLTNNACKVVVGAGVRTVTIYKSVADNGYVGLFIMIPVDD